MSLFEGRRAYPGQNISLILPLAAPRGTPIMRDTTDPTKGALANGRTLGFLVRDVQDGGPSVTDRAELFPGRLELPDATGGPSSLELFDEVEAEGPGYILLSGTGAIAANTARGTKLSFSGGRFYQAQGADIVQFVLADNSGLAGTALVPEVSGNLRIRAESVI